MPRRSPLEMPKRMNLANLPTPIDPLRKSPSPREDLRLFIKRDDYTGMEFSGNKIRKLEFIAAEVLEGHFDVLITCGGLQSNHCRATAAVAAKLGLKSHLVLKGQASSALGNYFMDQLFDAKISLVTDEDYRFKRQEIMQSIQEDYSNAGLKAFVIPEGASTGLGMFGYYQALIEILEQEKAIGLEFDSICIPCGSAGTYAGLYLANELLKTGKRIIGVNIYDKDKDFQSIVENMIREGLVGIGRLELLNEIDFDNISMIQGYVEGGYGVSTLDELEFIKEFSRDEGIILDPVYMGKGLHAAYSEIEKANPWFKGNVLFIHTGGLFGAFAKIELLLEA